MCGGQYNSLVLGRDFPEGRDSHLHLTDLAYLQSPVNIALQSHKKLRSLTIWHNFRPDPEFLLKKRGKLLMQKRKVCCLQSSVEPLNKLFIVLLEFINKLKYVSFLKDTFGK